MFNLQSERTVCLIFNLRNWFLKETDRVIKGKLVIPECENT